ncbi:MAG: DUF362 domain-containing protein, partial [Spirochaetales bacterium]|nr:DUF362 domain-containing protein [Spirochaetales bacterium]
GGGSVMIRAKVALLCCDRYEAAFLNTTLLRGFELLGGLRSFVERGEGVLLKPNILAGCPPERAVTTHPSVLEATIQILREAGARITYGDSSGIVKPQASARDSGLAAVAEKYRVEMGDFEHGRQTVLAGAWNGEPDRRRVPIARAVVESDALFNLAKMKTHQLTRITGAVKNLFGCVPGLAKPALHVAYPQAMDFSRLLARLHLRIRPRIHILDGILAMEGNGPRSGEPRRMNAIVMSRDPVAADAVFSRLIGLEPACVPTCLAGTEAGIGTYRVEEIEIVGEAVGDLVQPEFEVVRTGVVEKALLGYYPSIRNLLLPRPVIDPRRCRRCGICVRACPLPEKALEFDAGAPGSPPEYDYERCIRCYCCQEMCPHQAIGRKTPFLGKVLLGAGGGS